MEIIKLYSLKEVAPLLQISYPTLLKLIKNGNIGAAKVGGQWRIMEKELKRFQKEGNLYLDENIVNLEIMDEDEL